MSDQSTTEFWSGDFGDSYASRNVGRVEANIAFFSRVLPEHLITATKTRIKSAVELGCGTGENLMALWKMIPSVSLFGIEVNESSADKCKVGTITRGSFLTKKILPRDLSFTKGVLIHIAPPDLPLAYEKLYEASRKYILIAEYHNPTPVEVGYRGHRGKLWKRDFAAELWAAYPDLKLVSTGFAWKHDPAGSQDDLTWFLFRKKAK